MSIFNTKNIASVVTSLILFSAIPVVLAWTAPTSNPPNGNTPAPVTVGKVNQVKEASLGLNGLAVFGRGMFSTNKSYVLPSTTQKPDFLLGINGSVGAKAYCDEMGQNCFTPSDSGVNYSSVPTGAVMAFDLVSCPTGWSGLAEARGRFIVGVGNSQAPGAVDIAFRSKAGEASHTLTINEMPSHTHSLISGANYGNIGNGPAWTGWNHGESPNQGVGISYTGGNAPHNNMPPYYTLLYCKKN